MKSTDRNTVPYSSAHPQQTADGSPIRLTIINGGGVKSLSEASPAPSKRGVRKPAVSATVVTARNEAGSLPQPLRRRGEEETVLLDRLVTANEAVAHPYINYTRQSLPQKSLPDFARSIANFARSIANIARSIADIARSIANIARSIANFARSIAKDEWRQNYIIKHQLICPPAKIISPRHSLNFRSGFRMKDTAA
jgi:hypothetical protein